MALSNSRVSVLLSIPALALAVVSMTLLAIPSANGQDGSRGFVIRDNRVGYVDSAVIANQARLRYDFNSNITSGSRAEFFYTRPGSGPDSLPLAESSISTQDITFVLEKQMSERFSAMVELPFRYIDPVLNENARGMSDMNVAFKYALADDIALWTAQFRVYLPTGDADRGLGNNHVSLEPALLVHRPLGDNWTLEGELRGWFAVDGGELAGSVMRYGVGVHRPLDMGNNLTISPVIEFVGWTVTDGAETKPSEAMPVAPVNASGTTIVNGKFGARIDTGGDWDVYVGYGRVLTGPTWYEDVVRAELRLAY